MAATEGSTEGGPIATDDAESVPGRLPSISGRMRRAAVDQRVPLATILTTVAVIVVTGLGLIALWVLREEVLYLLVALFVALALTPSVNLLHRELHIRHSIAATLVFIIGLIGFAGLVFLFGTPLVTAVTHFSHQIPTLVSQSKRGRGPFGHLITKFHLQSFVRKNAPKLTKLVQNLAKPALVVGGAAFSTLISVATIAVLSYFVLLEADVLWRGFLGLFDPERAAFVHRVQHEVRRAVTGYVLGNALTSLIAGVVVFITLVVTHVPFALLLGLWVALIDLLPLVGGLLAGVPTVIIAFIHSTPAGIVTLIVFLVYQQVENHILNPLIMSKTVRLSPLWVLIAILVAAKLGDQVGSVLGGFIGALIGIPIGGAIQVFIKEIRSWPAHRAIGPAPAPESPGPST